jgi:hypothetical protein
MFLHPEKHDFRALRRGKKKIKFIQKRINH